MVAVTRLQTSTNSESTDKEKPKPLRIKVKIEQMRTLILSMAKLLAKSEKKKFQSIFLKGDATPLDRAEMQRNRENRKRKEGEPQKEPLGATECREMTGTNGDESVWCEATLMKNDKLLIG